MPSLASLKPGDKIVWVGELFEVIEARHVKLARSRAKAQVRIKNLLTGAIISQTFSGNTELAEADVSYQKSQYLYQTADRLFFMTPDTFEQIELKKEQIGVMTKFLKEGQRVDLMIWQNKTISASLPTKIVLQVTEAEPGLKGDRSQAGTKKITLETGAVIDAPLFIKAGDEVVVNTRTGEYVRRGS